MKPQMRKPSPISIFENEIIDLLMRIDSLEEDIRKEDEHHATLLIIKLMKDSLSEGKSLYEVNKMLLKSYLIALIVVLNARKAFFDIGFEKSEENKEMIEGLLATLFDSFAVA